MNNLQIKPTLFIRLAFVLGLTVFFIFLSTTEDSAPNLLLLLKLSGVSVACSVTGYGVIVLIANIKVGKDFKGFIEQVKININNARK